MAIYLTEAAQAAAVDQFGLMKVTTATARWFRQSIERLARHCPAEFADQVRPVDVAAWVEAERRGGAARPVTINSYLRGVRTVYSRLERRGLVEGNPARPVPFLKEARLDPKAIAEADYLAMRAAATCARDAAMVDVFWASGCRLGGLLSMKVDPGHLEYWNGPDGRPCFALLVVEKYDRPRWVYVGRDRLQGEGLAAWLAERPAVGGPLWLTSRGKPRACAEQTVQSVLRYMRQAAGIVDRPANAHAFRHAFAIRMLDQGQDIAAVAAWLGHHDPAFTAARYVLRSEAALREKYFGGVP